MIMGGAAAGLIGGFLGLGGGIVLVPLLTLVFKVPMHEAVAISLATIMASGLVSSTKYLEKGLVDYRLAVLLSIFAAVGAVTGSALAPLMPEKFLQTAFSIVLLYTTYSILSKKDGANTRNQSDRPPRLIPVALVALLAGMVSSLLGVGGGVLIVPAVYLIFNYSLDLSRGTSAFTIGIIATAGSVAYFARGALNMEYTGQIMLGTIAGGWLGGWLGARAKSRLVKVVFSIILIYLATRMFLQGIS